MDIIEKSLEMCGEHELLFLVETGSHLYGTHSENSDVDYTGVFLPSSTSCLLGVAPKQFSYTSNPNGKNSKEDVDITLWSLQYFLQMVKDGNTPALDLLFSYTHPQTCIYGYDTIKYVGESASKLFNVKSCKSFVGYATSQAHTYGNKGTRFKVLDDVLKFCESIHEDYDYAPLSVFINDIIQKFGHNSYCKTIKEDGKDYLLLVEKFHMFTITFREFKDRVKSWHSQYGNRTRSAINGVDWKALSHAYRAIVQYLQLIKFGKIIFPLQEADMIKQIKFGQLSQEEVIQMINDGIDTIDEILQESPEFCKFDKKFQELLILSFYGGRF